MARLIVEVKFANSEDELPKFVQPHNPKPAEAPTINKQDNRQTTNHTQAQQGKAKSTEAEEEKE